jgi:type IV pilus assembly protein PilA
MNTRQFRPGFTLIELMITIAIVGILAAVAIPSYMNYTQKARFSEVVQAVSALKPAVAQCIMTHNGLSACNNGTNSLPAEQGAVGNVASVTIADGVITGTGGNDAPADTYVLTPALTNNVVTWTVSGTCQTQGTC